MNEIFNHLWQSTAFAGAIALATLALRKNSPRVRYWLWFAASMKFLIPFSPLVSTGSRIPISQGVPSMLAVTVDGFSVAFAPVHVWWIGARLIEERERDCDEAVLRRGGQPGVYASSIVQVCSTYVESPLLCALEIGGPI